ncbi:CRISPR-associated endonuclease Cas2 [Kineosporia sp. J2-2]|uniref:CRISPR-associated endoribonuclease Cas2 n=1 Tax=Kineosporia corallincola TaxID=2835133 RepID=A0ABS5TTN6_9ACTN|nr:CRISPR-associated endonuclease Cas2 [Kineosporia corallincola]MBT0774163.1 CRISPR-associated endonuclease Cas2 [Kineosporia corallincola]
MPRRRHLLAYDIADPRRLRRVCKIMEEFGQRIQYSVFISDLSRTELVHARAAVEDAMNLREDSVVIIDLGDPDTASITFVGRSRSLPSDKPQIV